MEEFFDFFFPIYQLLQPLLQNAGDPFTVLPTYFLTAGLLPTSAQRRVNARLADNELLFSAFMDHLPGFAWIKNLDGCYLYVNSLLEQLPPYQQGWEGKTDADLWPVEMAKTYRDNDEQVIRDKATLETVETYTINGEQHHVLVNKFPIFDHEGTVVMVGGTSVDITERKQAEQALRGSEERYRELFENARDAVYVHDLNGFYIAVNRAAEDLTGYSREYIVGRHFSEFVEPSQVPQVRQQLARKLVKNAGTSYEVNIIARNGRSIPVEVSSNLIYENGAPAGVLGLARDITERKQSEDRLREYEKVVEGLEELIAVVDRDYRYLIANRALLRYRNLKREQLVGRLVSEIVGTEVFERVTKHKLDQCFEGHHVKYELTFTYPTLGERHLFVSYWPIRGTNGIDKVACVMQDITERKNAEERLRQSETQLLDAQRLAHIGSWNWELINNTVTWSDELYRIVGVSPDDFTPTYERVFEIVHEDDRPLLNAVIKAALTELKPFSFDYRIVRPDGKVRIIHSRGHVFTNDQGKPLRMFGAAQDVTELRRTEEALKNYSRQLIDAQEVERQNIARELHDEIGQVLTAVRIGLDAVKSHVPLGEAAPQLEANISIVDHALKRVRDLSLELHPALLDDLGLISALRWYTDSYAQRTGISTNLRLNRVDAKQRFSREVETACFRVVQEALTNVARHAHAKRAWVHLKRRNELLHLSIKDDGKGFDLESLHNRDASHVTLGLRSMEERAQALSGTLKIKSAAGGGSEVLVSLPLVERHFGLDVPTAVEFMDQ